MAKGDLLRDDEAFGSSVTLDLGANPTSGNLLIFAACVSGSSNTVSTPPSGFTAFENQGGASAGANVLYYKESDGTEQTASITWSGGNGIQWYGEIDMDGQGFGTVQSNDDETNTSSHVTSQDTGAVTPSQSTNLVVAFAYTNSPGNLDGGQSWSGSPHETYRTFSVEANAYSIAGYVDQTGSTEFTFSSTDSGSDMWGAILVVNDEAASGTTVSPNDVAQDQAIDAPSMTQDHQLDPDEVVQLQAVDAPSMTQDHQLDPSDVDQDQVTDAPSVTQDSQLQPGEVVQLQAIDAPSMTQDHQLDPNDVDQDQVIDAPSVTQDSQLQPNDVAQLQVIDLLTVLQNHQLDPNDVAQLQAADLVVISVDGSLTPNDVDQLQVIDGVTVLQDHQLQPGEVVQLQVIGGATVAIPTGYIPRGRALIVTDRARAVWVMRQIRTLKV